MSKSTVDVSGGGLLSLILGIILLWAMCFGVTWNGKHYGLSCSMDRGVEIDH
jgi:hypothetical protein